MFLTLKGVKKKAGETANDTAKAAGDAVGNAAEANERLPDPDEGRGGQGRAGEDRPSR